MLRAIFARTRVPVPSVRFFHQTSIRYSASVFKMPAMSPTMTEGGIVSWKVKPGDTYNAGDVLLEVETDKANIDVEAADDGKLWEILENDGAKGVPVGKAIAYIADVDDDLSSLEKPKVEENKEEEKKKGDEEKKREEPKEQEEKKETKSQKKESSPSKSSKSKATESGSSDILQKANPNQKFSPAVELLLHENNISHDDAIAKIQATGPNGRILKGDVLAYLGTIPLEAVVDLAKYIRSREHLDLSNIQVAKPTAEDAKEQEQQQKQSGTTDAKPKPTNVLSVEFSAPLAEHLNKIGFKQAFESAIDSAIHDTYAHRFPQYATSPSPSIYDQYDVFEELVTAPVTKRRFEVYDLKYDFHGDAAVAKSSRKLNQTLPRTDFDDLIGLPNDKTPVVEVGATPRANVSFKVKFDEQLSDSREFVKYFENALLEEAELYDIPANLLRVSN
ncbi:PDX1 [Candida theae]|uniref:Dihydrolipoamide dehydrogenase-binding protein of pyruvate dehydrogenase complex n=1 Tax=Candida theae TaxID=1198502 RepID=A0AAD5B9I5_9ASCO|nr:PDX1 [Candida theae]KAI5948614.1 PDX1 [Candida theae]